MRALCLLFYSVWDMICNMLYMTRHAETYANSENIISPDGVALNEKGLRQAYDLAQYFKSADFGIERITASDFLRAKQTAKVIRNELSVPVEYDIRLREYDFGNLKGKSSVTLSTATRNQFLQDPTSVGAEPFEDAFARISAFCSMVDYNTNTLVVSHSGIMRFAILYFNDGHQFDLRKFMEILRTAHIKNADVFRVAAHNAMMERIK